MCLSPSRVQSCPALYAAAHDVGGILGVLLRRSACLARTVHQPWHLLRCSQSKRSIKPLRIFRVLTLDRPLSRFEENACSDGGRRAGRRARSRRDFRACGAADGRCFRSRSKCGRPSAVSQSHHQWPDASQPACRSFRAHHHHVGSANQSGTIHCAVHDFGNTCSYSGGACAGEKQDV